MAEWDELDRQEQRTYGSRRAAKDGNAFWNHEAKKDERVLMRMELGDDIDD